MISFSKPRLKPQGQDHFLNLAPEGPLAGEEDVLGKLLGERRAAFRNAAPHQVAHGGSGNAERVNPQMSVEAAILDGDDRTRQMLGQFGKLDRRPHGAAVNQHVAGRADNRDIGRALRHFEFRHRRQMRSIPPDHACDGQPAPQADDETPVDKASEKGPLVLFL